MLAAMNARTTSTYLGWMGCTLAALAFVSSAACEPDEEYESGSRGLQPSAFGPATSAQAPETPAAAAGGRRSASGSRDPGAAPSLGYAPVPSAAAAPEDPNAPPRELSTELRAMMGQPLACLAGAAPAPTITVVVGTVVDAHGNVLRATATGPLTPEGLACMQARAQALRFRAPVPRAPIHVTARIEFRMTNPGTEATRTAIDEPRVLPPGAVDPMGGNAVPIAPRAGQAIVPRAGQPIAPSAGTPVTPTQGVSIMGPSGTPIGR